MEVDLPFEPRDAYQSLQALLPVFAYDIPELDLRQFIIDGFISRRYVLRGRFKGFGHTRIMRSSADLGVETFLTDPIPKDDPNPLYRGDAIGFIVEGESRFYTRSDDLWLTAIPNNKRLIFVYQRPSIFQTFTLASDIFFDTVYKETFNADSSAFSERKTSARTSSTIFQFLNTGLRRLLFLEESFQQAVKQQSVFGFSKASMRAMQGLSLTYRISTKYEDAERVLLNALSLASDIQDGGIELESDLLLNLGGLYLDQKKSDDAEKHFFKVTQLLQQFSTEAQRSLRIKGLEGLTAVHFQKGSLQAAETFLGQVIEHWRLHGGTECSEYLAAENILGVIYRAQGELNSAALTCTRILSCQEEQLGLIHHESLRTLHNLAGVLVDRGQFSEAEVLYLREIHSLEEILGTENIDTLRTVRLLARAYYKADKMENAVTIWKRVAETSERSLGLAEISTMESKFQLAKSLGRLGEHHEAIKLLMALAPYNMKILGYKHPISRGTRLLLANLSRRLGNSIRASALMGELFDEIRMTSSHLANNGEGSVGDILPSPTALFFQTYNDDRRLKILLGLKEKGTCDWIFNHDPYKAWLTSHSPSLLWINGGPGTGKTMLAATVIADLQRNQNAVIHFFFDSRDVKNSTVAGLLSSLVAQMKQIRLRLQNDGPRMPQRSYNPIATLFDEFSEIASGFEELYCCIDAIDEADEWKMTLVRGIFDLVKSEASPIKFFLTSRPPIISLSSSEGAFIVQLPNNGTIRDIRQVICSNLRALRQQGKTIRGDQIESRLEKVADGSFLWVELVLAVIGRTEEYNDEFPQSLQEQYNRSLHLVASELGDSQKELLVLILYWLTTSLRPLTVRELQLAIAIEPFKQSLDEMRLLLSPSESIAGLGGPLVQIRDDDTVVLVHQSLREYLLSSQAPVLRISSQIAIPISPTEGNSLVTSICLTYLSFPCFNSTYNSESTTQHSLLQYAACHWYLHAVQTGKRLSMFRSVANFLYSRQGFNWLDGLQHVFHKSIGELLVIQSKIRQWAQQFDQTDVPQVDDLVLTLYRRKFEEGRIAFPDSKERLEFLKKFADISQATGHLDQAERLYKEVLGNTLPTMPGDLRLHLKDGVTTTSESEARWKGQEELKTHLVRDSDVNFGVEYPLNLSSKENLAIVYQNQGRWKEAENLDTEVIELRRKILGPEHPETLSSMSNLGSIYRDQGRWIEAEGLEIEVTKIRKRVLGLEHPSTLASMNNLAEVLSSQGKYEEAERVHREVLKLRVIALGKEHPDTLLSMNNLAMVLDNQGKYEEAERVHQEVLKLRVIVLGTEHPSTLMSMNNLALVLDNQGKYETAEKIHQQVLTKKKRILGTEHPFTLLSMNNLAKVLGSQGKYKEAERVHQEVLELRVMALGKQHPDTLLSMNNLAMVLGNQGKHVAAEDMHQQALASMVKILGTEHPATLSSMNNLGNNYKDQGKLVDAELMFQRALDGQEKIWGPEHTFTLSTISSLGLLYKDQGKLREAEAMFRRALDGYQKLTGPNHPSTISIRRNLNSLEEHWMGNPGKHGEKSETAKVIRLENRGSSRVHEGMSQAPEQGAEG